MNLFPTPNFKNIEEHLILGDQFGPKGAKMISSFFWTLQVLAMSSTRFRVNPHSIVAQMPNSFLLKTGAKSEV